MNSCNMAEALTPPVDVCHLYVSHTQLTRLRAGRAGFESRLGQGLFVFATASRPVAGPTQPPIQWVAGALFLGLKRPGCEANRSPPSVIKVKNTWTHISTPLYIFMTGCLIKHRIRIHGVVLGYAYGHLHLYLYPHQLYFLLE
jgi:hypothetical protein